MNRNMIIAIFGIVCIILAALLIVPKNNNLGFLNEYANELKLKKLSRQAIAEYQNYLNIQKDLPKKQIANINYIIADIYYNELKDYENALAGYIKIKYIDPNNELMPQINQKIVSCLENLGRSLDAQVALEDATFSGKNKKPSKDIMLAKIGSDLITQSQFETWLAKFPEDLKKKLNKEDLLKQFIVSELLYRIAIRKGLENNADVLNKTFDFKKNIMIQSVFKDEVMSGIKIEPSDMKLYYEAHKKDFGTKTLEEAKEIVYQRLFQEKIQEASSKLLDRLAKAENVQIFGN